MKKTIIILAVAAVFLSGQVGTLIVFQQNKIYQKFFSDSMQIKELDKNKEADYKADFMAKSMLARQVYQFSWYKKINSRLGKINGPKYYAMNLQEYDKFCQKIWEYNRRLSIPLDSAENYYPLGKYITESSINEKAEHKTGEIILWKSVV